MRSMVLAAALMMGAAAAPGQDRAPVFATETDLVYLTVTVTDDDGHLVTDLPAADFTVLEEGRPQDLAVFARAVEPGGEETLALNVGMLFDTSASMLDQLRLSQEAAVRFLDAIPRARELVTVFFDQDIRISHYDSESQQGLPERLLSAEVQGKTALYDAIAAYLSRVRGHGRHVLVLFTDGEDSISRLTQGQILERLADSPVTVYPIAFSGGLRSQRAIAARAFLSRAAEISGGRALVPLGSRDLPAIYQRILDELSGQYVLGFASSRPRDGRFHKLKVKVKGSGLEVRHRQGYRADLEETARE